LPSPVPPPVTRMRRPARSLSLNMGGFRLGSLSFGSLCLGRMSVNWLID
jgi:hypothetical protein